MRERVRETGMGRKYQDVDTAELKVGMGIKDRGQITHIEPGNGWVILYMRGGGRITALPADSYRVHRSTIPA